MSAYSYVFLGTGTSQGVPVIGCTCAVCRSTDARDSRLRCSFYVQSSSTKIVIDCGPDFRQQFLKQQLTDVDAVLITHEHQDHTAGLDELRAINFMQHKRISVYGSAAVLGRLREQYSYIFSNPNYPGIPQIDLRELPEGPFTIGDIEVQPILAQHMDLPVRGFRMGDCVYLTDANHISRKEKDKMKNSPYLVLNALRQTSHHSHFSLPEALALADELQAGEAYFTHISHQMGLHEEVQQTLAPGRFLAYDGLRLA